MTGGSALYLLMCLGVFGGLSWVLASVSGQQSRRDADRAKAASDDGKDNEAVTA